MHARAAVVLVMASACGRVGFDPLSGGDGGVDAPDTAACAVLENVRSGDLVIGAAETMVDLPLVVPMSRTLLVTTVRLNEESPSHGATRCELTPSGIHCERSSAGTDRAGSDATIRIHWTAVTFSAGVLVQRGLVDLGDGNPALVTIEPIALDQSFIVLGGGSKNVGAGWGNNEFVRARLIDSTTLDIRTASGGSEQVSWQVVRMAGARVERGAAIMPAASTSVPQPLAIADTTASFTTMSHTIGSGSIAVGGTMADSGFPFPPMGLGLYRQFSGPELDISWEVVTPPFSLQRGSHTFGTTTQTQTLPLSGLNAATTVAFASGQSLVGPSRHDHL